VNFSPFWAATRIAPKWLERDQDNLHMKFSALNLAIQGGLRTRVSNRGTPLKSGYLFAVGLSSVKTIAYRHRHAAHHNKH